LQLLKTMKYIKLPVITNEVKLLKYTIQNTDYKTLDIIMYINLLLQNIFFYS